MLASPDTQALVISFVIAVAISMFVYTDMKQKEIDALLLRVHREDYVQLIELIFDTIRAYKTPALRKKLVQKIKDFEKRHLVLGAPHLMTLFRRYESILQQKPPQTDLENALDGLTFERSWLWGDVTQTPALHPLDCLSNHFSTTASRLDGPVRVRLRHRRAGHREITAVLQVGHHSCYR